MRPKVTALLLAATTLAHAQLTPEERKGIADTLFLANLTTQDLEYDRRPFDDAYRLPAINLAIDKPLESADFLLGLHQEIAKVGPPQVLKQIDQNIFGHGADSVRLPPAIGSTKPKPEDKVKDIALALAHEIARANARVTAALKNLTPQEQAQLVASLPSWAVEEPAIKFGFSKGSSLKQDQIQALLAKVDLKGIRWAAEQLAGSVQAYVILLKPLAGSKLDTLSNLQSEGIAITIGGTGDDNHTESSALIIDLGGDDHYSGRVGASIRGASVFIDLGGDDSYRVGDMSLGAGLLGIGLAYDLGGHDTFRAGSLSLGAGLAGVGMLFKDGGHDLYDSVALTQGFGQFGIGALIDTRGDDHYTAKFYAQGAGRTQGVGWLNDRAGSDIYRAGGLILNSPLFKDVYYSNAQGYGAGYREDTGGISGGIGLLTDTKGDDSYLGETYSQAASYWFSIGSLFDGDGHDTYRGYHYNQASAMHMTSAYLFDLAGDDSYINNYGAAHAIGHDYGVAFMLDRKGNDVYSGRDSRPGIGNANGLGMFIDAAGEDRYSGPPAIGNGARGSGSLAVFADLQGPDQYRDGLADAQGAVRSGGWAVAYDVETLQGTAATTTLPEAKQAPTPGSRPMPSDAEMEKIYAKAIQWGVGTAQQEVAENVNMLIAIGDPAFAWMVNKKLASANRLSQRAFVAVLNALGLEAKKVLAAKIASENPDESRMALAISIETNNREAASQIPAALKRPHLRRTAARAAGALGSVESVPDLLGITGDRQDRIAALNSVISLAQLKDPQSYSTGEALLRNPDITIRKAAIGLVAAFPAEAFETAKKLLADPDERTARTAIELLGVLGTPEALDAIVPSLKDQRAGVKIQALLALDTRCPPDSRPDLLDLRRDPHPLVRAVAQRIDPGR